MTTYGAHVRALFLFLSTSGSGVFPYSVHYPRPKYEQDHGTSPPVGNIFLDLVSLVLLSLRIRLFQAAKIIKISDI